MDLPIVVIPTLSQRRVPYQELQLLLVVHGIAPAKPMVDRSGSAGVGYFARLAT